MNPDASLLARDAFSHAMQPGPTREPKIVAALFARLDAQADGNRLDVDELEEALDAEFPWRNQLVFQSRELEPEEFETWIVVVRWLVQSLLVEPKSAEVSAQHIQVALAALGSMDIGRAGLSAIAEHFAGSRVPTSIVCMLENLRHVSEGWDARSEEWLRELPGEVKAGNFKMLQHARGFLKPPLHSDISTSVFLLWKLEPAGLARLVDSRDDILLSIQVCRVLDADAPLFALQVESVTFKFISLSYLEHPERICSEIDNFGVLVQLLLQVAQTPYWNAWLQATYEHPSAQSGHSRALAEALTQLAEAQWKDFILALALSTSQSSALAVANILMHVARKLGSVKAQPIWLAAFKRWDVWDYGSGERQFYLSSAKACAFDFPVAMYYAALPATERGALERELQDAIIHVEQRWFFNEAELCTERNRLASRLRLARYGSAVAVGGIDTLPPPVRPDSEYAEVRYRYYDVS